MDKAQEDLYDIMHKIKKSKESVIMSLK